MFGLILDHAPSFLPLADRYPIPDDLTALRFASRCQVHLAVNHHGLIRQVGESLGPLPKFLLALELPAVDLVINGQETLLRGQFSGRIVGVGSPLTTTVLWAEDGELAHVHRLLVGDPLADNIEHRPKSIGKARAVSFLHTVLEYPICITHRERISELFHRVNINSFRVPGHGPNGIQ